MKRTLSRLCIAVSLLVAVETGSAEVPNDFDGDGISDLVFTAAGTNATLVWKAILSSTGTETTISSGFGVAGDYAVTGFWRDTNTPPYIALLRYDSIKRTLEWKMQFPDSPLIVNREFGKGSIFAMAGADFDGDGLGDAAVIRQKGKYWLWSVKTSPFADSGSVVRKVRFGKVKDRVFYMNPGGVSDRIATFGTCSRKYACVRMAAYPKWTRSSTGHFPRSLATRYGRPRPVPIRQSDGADALAFITEGKGERRVRVYRKNGSKVADVSIAQLGGYAIGDYLPESAGEEIAFQVGTSILVYNPFVGTPAPVAGTPTPTAAVIGTLVDGILTEVLIAATPTPGPTSTPVPTVTTQ